MNTKEAQDLVEIVNYLSKSHKENLNAHENIMHGFVKELLSTQKLWRANNKSFLIKAGLALIAFPDPTITDIIGSAMVAAGIIQLKIQNSQLYVEDTYKTFLNVVKELGTIKQSMV